jgi:heme-degrading monooxygenase HmoA
MQYPLTNTPSKSKPLTQIAWTPPLEVLSQQLSSNFTLSTLLLTGACIQVIVLSIFQNSRYVFLPAFVLLGIKLLDALLIASDIRSNPYMKNVFLGRRSAFVPDENGQITDERQKVVILLLGAKSNHPFGIFAPRFIKLGDWLSKMNSGFDTDPPEGFLGSTGWERKDENGAREFNFISYWRSIEDLHEYAHGPLHREAWMWWEKTLKLNNSSGINHEIFEANPGQWENVYVNFQPTGLGATTVLRKGDKLEGGVVDDEWIIPLVDVRRGKLAKSSARLGRDPIKYDANRPNADAYA